METIAKIAYALLIVAHACIHVAGATRLVAQGQVHAANAHTVVLKQPGSLNAGVLWLAAAFLMVAWAVVLLWGVPWWWMPALVAIAVSQVLIVTHWQQAKWGTLVNGLLLLPALAAMGTYMFYRAADKQAAAISAASSSNTSTNIHSLPPVVQQWLAITNAASHPVPNTIRLEQLGQMRTKPNGKWMDVAATQYFSTAQPAFVWKASVKAAPLLYLQGRDSYMNGTGNMNIKAAGLLPVADASGPETNQASMLRFLAEMVWFPGAATLPYIQWQQVDTARAKATITWAGQQAGGIFTFSRQGHAIAFDAERFYTQNGRTSPQHWHIDIDEHSIQNFEGISIPTQSTVTWKLAGGDFTWYRVRVFNVTYQPI